ncbi:hypothetical protein Ade02nite_04820 [Paractinoplanes deccanensis]|uniref:Lipoprotein n=1 Tax=Paractinoplanes deccanensis TaxID=113561 RepID=A0ABQ3XVU3_9ACTN|nr:hypothetical protein [Actinoplanes deccanensis]GID71841.1 hypothetical protein Ade02nite_04820 [Actinoplanes deccanensis]
MHRLAQISCAATLVALVAACGNGTTGHEDAAAPARPSSSASAPGGSAGGAPTATPASQAPPTSQPVKETAADAADLIIHPDHIGPLKIGMSLGAAKATGLIVVNADQDGAGPGACVSAHWKGQPDDAWMVFNGKYGLRALDSFGNQKTPEGIKRDSTLAAVRKAYPQLTWRIDGDDIPDAQRVSGDALADVVKGDGAHYRINIQKGKVADVQLESDRTGCYE